MLLILFAAQPLLAVDCPLLNFAGFENLRQINKPHDVVFFASWCSSCRHNLTDPKLINPIFIALFDERKNAEEIAEKFAFKGPCFSDDGIAEVLKINALPAKILVN